MVQKYYDVVHFKLPDVTLKAYVYMLCIIIMSMFLIFLLLSYTVYRIYLQIIICVYCILVSCSFYIAFLYPP